VAPRWGHKATGVGRDFPARTLRHRRELPQRLQHAGGERGERRAQAERAPVAWRRARQQGLARAPRASEWSAAMRHTPTQRRSAPALRGFWPACPVSPPSHANRRAAHVQTRGGFAAPQACGSARQLDTCVDGVPPMLHPGQEGHAHAMLRAFLSVVTARRERADDACGCLGDSCRGGVARSLALPLDATGIDATVFCHALLTRLLWEEDGWTSEHTDGDFAGLPPQEGALCLAYGPQQREDRRGDDLDSPYEEALPLRGQLGAEQHRFERVEALARHLGTRHWQRRIGFADRAIKTRTRPLAVAVFEAALRPGLHEGFWRRQYEQLKKGKWRPDPRRSEPLIRLCDRVRCAWV
jgi:hypothetical protein